jgi:hypothetical protein
MSQLSETLSVRRTALQVELNKVPVGDVGSWRDVDSWWVNVKPVIDKWWSAYKAWEAGDTFNKAFLSRRMTVRTFPGGVGGFEKQVAKEFDRKEFKVGEQKTGHRALRGIDGSAFANPANFGTSDKKYEAGLHDLSASLLNPALPIIDQIHNNEKDSHFAFLPLSKEADQEMLFQLIRMEKRLRLMLPAMSDAVRGFRAEMTRVKLAYEYDMAVNFSLTGKTTAERVLKVRYGLMEKTTIVGRSLPVTTTPEMRKARQDAALAFKSILGIRDAKNEIVIAVRKHAGPFPVYAVRDGVGGKSVQKVDGETMQYPDRLNDTLRCYSIENNRMKFNDPPIRISARGVMTVG